MDPTATAAQTPHGRSSAAPLPQLLLLSAAMAAGGYVRTALSPLQESLRLAWGLGDTHMAILQGPAVGLPFVLAAMPLGLLIDRTRRTRLLRVLLGLSLAGSVLTAWSTSFNLLIGARALAGVCGLAVLPVVLSLVADLYPPTQRGRATTVVIVGQVIGNSCAFALGGALLSAFQGHHEAWRLAMAWLSAPIALVLLFSLGIREPERHDVIAVTPSLANLWVELAEHRAITSALAVGVIVLETAVGAVLIWAAPLLARKFAMAPGEVGGAMAAAMLVSGVAGPALGGFMADRCQARGGPRLTTLVLAMIAIAILPLSAFPFAPGPASVLALLTAAMTVMLAGAIMGMTLFTVVIPNELRGLCTSMLMAGILLGALAAAPVLVSSLSAAFGGEGKVGEALALVCSASAVLGGASFMAAHWTLGRRNQLPAL